MTTAAEVMRNGVVVCDADSSIRAVARTMRDQRVRAVFVVDLGGESIGLVSEADLLRGWGDVDRTTAAEVTNLDPLVIDPAEPVEQATRRMLEAGIAHALVAAPPPLEETGRWSQWKERGMPLGTLSVADILARLDELGSAVRTRPAPGVFVGRGRIRPWLATAGVLLVVATIALLLFVFLRSHALTVSPGCSHPTQGGC